MNENCLFPFELVEMPKVRKMVSELRYDSKSLLIEIFVLIKKGKGIYPLSGIMLLSEGNKARKRRLHKMLTNYGIFKIEHGMVSFRKGLLRRRQRKDTSSAKEQQIEDLKSRDNSQTLFPEELDSMDSETAHRLNSEINQQTAMELIDFV